jgi:hypothetical protein
MHTLTPSIVAGLALLCGCAHNEGKRLTRNTGDGRTQKYRMEYQPGVYEPWFFDLHPEKLGARPVTMNSLPAIETNTPPFFRVWVAYDLIRRERSSYSEYFVPSRP